MKQSRKIIIAIFTLFFVVIPATLSFVVQLPSVQTRLSQVIAEVASDNINGTISVSNIYYALFGRLVIEDIEILDEAQDTVVFCDKLYLHFTPLDLLEKTLKVNKFTLSGGVINIIHNPDSTLNISKIFPTKSEKKESSFNFNIDIERIVIKDFKLNRIHPYGKDPVKPITGMTIDWRDLHIFDLNMDIRDISFQNMDGRATIAGISMKEERGFALKNLSLELSINSFGVMCRKLNYQDLFTNLTLDHAYLLSDNLFEIENIFEDVTFDASIGNDTFFDMKTLQGYLPGLETLNLQLYVSGDIFGTIADANIDNLNVYTATRKTHVGISARLFGLPIANETIASLSIYNCYTDFGDIEWIINHVSPKKNQSLSKLAPGHKISFTGSVDGLFEDFVAFGAVKSENLGDIFVDIVCRNELRQGYQVRGNVNTSGFDLGEFLQIKSMGGVDFNASAEVFAAADQTQSYISLDSLWVNRFDFKEYPYSNIVAGGTLRPSGFVGNISSGDPNINFNFDGLFSFLNNTIDGESTYDFALNVKNIDLVELNFDEETRGNFRLDAYANLNYSKDQELQGDIWVDSITYNLNDKLYNLGRIDISANKSIDKITTVGLTSSFLNGSIETNTPSLGDIIKDIKTNVVDQHISNILDKEGENSVDQFSSENWYNLHFETADLRPIFDFVFPNLFVDRGTTIDLSMNRMGQLDGNIHSELIALNDIYIKGLNIDLLNNFNALTSIISTELTQLGSLKLLSDTIDISVTDNIVDLNISYNNQEDLVHKGEINSTIILHKKYDSQLPITAHLYDSQFSLYNDVWELYDAEIDYTKNNIIISDLGLFNDEQSLSIHGILSENVEDTCHIILNNFNTAIANPIIGDKLTLGGKITGYADISSIFSDLALNTDINIDSLSVMGSELGDLALTGEWYEDMNGFGFELTNTYHDSIPLYVRGLYDIKASNLNANAKLNKFGLSIIDPFLVGVLENNSGDISGDIYIKGPLDSLVILSPECNLNNFNTTVSFTGVPYDINGSLFINENGIFSRNLRFTDPQNNSGRITGGLRYNRTNNMALDLTLRFNNLLSIDNDIYHNPTIYGKAYSSGSVNVAGPFNALKLNIDIKTAPNTIVHIPLMNNGKEQAPAITFVSDIKPTLHAYDSLILLRDIKKEMVRKNQLQVGVKAEVTPDADVLIEINRHTGDIIRGKGVGYIDLNLVDGKLDLTGDYSINEGSYRFGMLNIITRDFTIEPGSKLNFVGDVLDTEFDLQAIYKTKASISALVSDSTSTNNRRNVNCGIELTGKLSDLNIDFDIEVPDLDPTSQGFIENALNSEEKRLKQFLALMVSNSFLPDEQSGINENSSLSLLNATELLTNQLNSILNELNIPVDLGFNYALGATGKNIFDVAISTQLFNNRVSINGNIGNREFISSTQRGDIVGDIDIEVKLNKNGKMRFNLFSHSSDQFSSYLDQTQRNGAGFVIQEDFNTFQELLRSIFWSKKRKTEYEEMLLNETEVEESSEPIILKSTNQ